MVLTQPSLGRGTGRMGCRWSARGARVLTASGLGSLSGLTAQLLVMKESRVGIGRFSSKLRMVGRNVREMKNS